MIFDILGPYMTFISIFITVVLNVLLLIYHSNWYSYIIANAILLIVWNFVVPPQYSSFNLIGGIIDSIVDLIKDIISGIFSINVL